MTYERTVPNLLIGLALSLLLHATMLLWKLPIFTPASDVHLPTAVEVQLREWPTPPSTPSSPESTTLAEPPAPPPKPALPPNTQALAQAVQTAVTPTPTDRVEVALPERLPSLPTLDAQPDAVHLAETLRESLQHEPRLGDAAVLPELPAPERSLAEVKGLPALPTLEAPARREPSPARPATVSVPSSPPSPAVAIKGPASERQVVFQPPPPSVTVESESEIELRFWILPNGAVGRVVPVKKSDPRLEALAINYLRHWRFTPLPSDAVQDEQWGVIPFKFRIR